MPQAAPAPILSEQPNSVSAAAASTTPSHPCRLCGRVYERADHLNRHLKSHENARPNKCTRCNKSFNRVDLLNRHQAGHDKQRSGKIIERGERVAAACVGCVTAKAKCQDQKPCTRCKRRGIQCEVTSSGSVNVQTDLEEDASSFTISEGRQQKQPSSHHAHFSPDPSQATHVNTTDPTSVPYNHEQNRINELEFVDPLLSAAQGLSGNTLGQNLNQHHSMYDENPMESVFASTDLELSGFSNTTTNQQFSAGIGLLPLDSYNFGIWDIDLDNVDLSFLDLEDMRSQEDRLSPRAVTSQPALKPVSNRYAAFERSPWLWTPTQKDQALNDQHHLSLDEDTIASVLTPDTAPPSSIIHQYTSFSVGQRQRDQMFSLVLSLHRLPKPTTRFPSLSILNSLIQVYFSQEAFRFNSFIHAGTFCSSTKILPQLLLAIISAGSTLISTPAIWKMGLALQEVVRHTLAEYWEENNSNTRDLQSLQAFVIILDVGLWSGFRRNMEIAESFAQPLITMMRRSGAFAAARDEALLVPTFDDSQTVLQAKWEKWAKNESLKRLVLHTFMHDAHASMSLQKPPAIPFTELKISLPASRALWSAETATDWRDRFLENKCPNLPSLLGVVHIPETLPSLSSHVDTHLTVMTLLNGYWGQVWSVMEAKKFFPISKSTHRLAIHTSHTELYRDISSFSKHVTSLTRNFSEALLGLELCMMILHVSPDDLQRFAGKFGEDEAQKVGRQFAHWSRTAEARTAIWHAGQVFRAAKLLTQAKNRGFNSIALYFASLTLWVYGLMISRTSSTRPQTPQNPHSSTADVADRYSQQDRIVLNEAESLYAQVFRTGGQGMPGITYMDGGTEQFLELRNADRVLDIARDIYKNNYPVSDEPLPPLVENLGNLLRDLSNLSSSFGSRLPSESPT